MQTLFEKNKDIQERNFDLMSKWIGSISPCDKEKKNNYIWDIDSPEPIHRLLNQFRIHPFSRGVDPKLISKYIEKVNNIGELTSWTVALISSSTAKNQFSIGEYQIGLTERRDLQPDNDLYWLQKANMISPEDQYIDFDENQLAEALSATVDAWRKGETRHTNEPTAPSGPFIRRVREPQRGLLLIYPLDSSSVTLNEEQSSELPIIGMAFSFPASNVPTMVEYQVNTKFWIDRYGEDEDV